MKTIRPFTWLVLLALLSLSWATITIQAPSPPNLSTVIGTSATFNWTASGTACTASQLWIFKEADSGLFNQFGLVPVASCGGTVTLNNLTDGYYGWVVGTTAIPPENSSFWNFTVAPSINLTITYPPNNSIYGPGQCWLLATVQLNDSGGPGASRSVLCSLYLNNGTAYVLNQTASLAGNGSVNLTGLIASPGNYAINCSATVDAGSANSATTNFQTVGASYCAGQPNDQSPQWIFLALIIVAATMMFWGLKVLQ